VESCSLDLRWIFRRTSCLVKFLWHRARHHRVNLKRPDLLDLGVRSYNAVVAAFSHHMCRVSPLIKMLSILLLCLSALLSRLSTHEATTFNRARGAHYASVIVINNRVHVCCASVQARAMIESRFICCCDQVWLSRSAAFCQLCVYLFET